MSAAAGNSRRAGIARENIILDPCRLCAEGGDALARVSCQLVIISARKSNAVCRRPRIGIRRQARQAARVACVGKAEWSRCHVCASKKWRVKQRQPRASSVICRAGDVASVGGDTRRRNAHKNSNLGGDPACVC